MAIERRHIITISGKPGSGKSSTAERVAELLGYTRYSSGDMVRDLAKKRHMTLAEFNEMAAKNPDWDHQIDARLRALRDNNDIVIDSRLGFYWIPESFKVFLWLNNEVAMARIYRDSNFNTGRSQVGEGSAGMDDIVSQVEERSRNEQHRFRKLYNVNPFDTARFDLIVDTSRHSPQTVALTVFDIYKKWLVSSSWKQVTSKVPLGYSYNDEFK